MASRREGEPGLANVRMQLYVRNASGSLEPMEDTFTDSNGSYRFFNLTPGTQYRVRVYRPEGYVFTAQDAGSDKSADSDAGSAGSSERYEWFQAVVLNRDQQRTDLDVGFYSIVPTASPTPSITPRGPTSTATPTVTPSFTPTPTLTPTAIALHKPVWMPLIERS